MPKVLPATEICRRLEEWVNREAKVMLKAQCEFWLAEYVDASGKSQEQDPSKGDTA